MTVGKRCLKEGHYAIRDCAYDLGDQEHDD